MMIARAKIAADVSHCVGQNIAISQMNVPVVGTGQCEGLHSAPYRVLARMLPHFGPTLHQDSRDAGLAQCGLFSTSMLDT